jgi:hypothetical protein
MSLAKISASMLTASVLALTAACSGPSSLSLDAPSEALPSRTLPSETLPPETQPSPATIEAASIRPSVSAGASNAGVAAALPPEPASVLPVRKSPMQALNQMVTTQALLVSLLLAPLSKGAAEQPLARVDAPRTTRPTH